MPLEPRSNDVAIVVHAPERRRRSTTLYQVGCYGCCCCCCLHTVGLLAGAIYGQTRRIRAEESLSSVEEDDQDQELQSQLAREIQIASRYATRVYWLSLLAIISLIACCAITVAMVNRRNHWQDGDRDILMVVAGFFLPLGHFCALVLAWIYILIFPRRRPWESFRRLRHIAHFSTFGCLWGILLLVILLFAYAAIGAAIRAFLR